MNISELFESFNFKAYIVWSEESNSDIGKFNIADEFYKIVIEHFTLQIDVLENKKIEDVIQIGFSRILNGADFTSKIESENPNKVFSAVYNGVIEKIENINVDAIVFSAKKINGDTLEFFEKRSKLYEKLAQWVSRRTKFGFIENKFQNTEGDHFILIIKKLNLSNDEITQMLEKLK